MFTYPKLMKLFADFDLYIAEQLVRTFISQKTPLINDIYRRHWDNRWQARYIPQLLSYTHAQNVIDPLGRGRSQYQGRLPGGDGCHLELELEDYRRVRLLRLYGIANHFDFTAFEIRHMYIAEGPLGSAITQEMLRDSSTTRSPCERDGQDQAGLLRQDQCDKGSNRADSDRRKYRPG